MQTAGGKNKAEKFSIQNEFLKVEVLSRGAELCSLKKLATNTEYIWQANPEIWSSHAPNLFPVIGALKDNEIIYEGKAYPLTRHGFIRNNENILLKESSEDRLIFQYSTSEESLKMYPFKFNFEISFLLKDQALIVSHQVANLGNKPMYFSLGGHPAFNVPLFAQEEYEDYYLEFDQNQDLQTHLLDEKGLILEATREIIRNDSRIQLHKKLFDNDALVFKNISSKEVALKNKKLGTVLKVEFKDFKHLGIWAKPAAPFVCIEPWLGYADVVGTLKDIKTKEGINKLMPSGKFDASYTITIA